MDTRDVCEAQATVWLARAKMAHQQGNRDLTIIALDKMWQYQKAIADFDDLPHPDCPTSPEVFFKDWKPEDDYPEFPAMPR